MSGDKVPRGKNAQESGTPTREEIQGLYADAVEVESFNDLSNFDHSQKVKSFSELPAGTALSSLLHLAPFAEYLERRAVNLYTHESIERRVSKYCKEHKYVANFCTIADLLVRSLVILLLLLIVVVFAFKALLPLPSIF